MNQYNQPVVNIQGVERSKCCVLDTMDLCGRQNCIQCRNMTREDLPLPDSAKKMRKKTKEDIFSEFYCFMLKK